MRNPHSRVPLLKIHVYVENTIKLDTLAIRGEFMRTLVTLACTDCKRRNYTTKKNKQNNPDRIEMNKYCKWCGHHTLHKETR